MIIIGAVLCSTTPKYNKILETTEPIRAPIAKYGKNKPPVTPTEFKNKRKIIRKTNTKSNKYNARFFSNKNSISECPEPKT